MSSLRNAVRRREHRERSQVSERSKYGLLEKHKDYVLRAKDFHRKEQTLQKLREKAAGRNPDEFYHKMINSKVVDGIHRPKGEAKQYSQDELKLMKTQDIKYVLNKAQSEVKKVEKLQSALHFVDQERINKHVYFAEDREEFGAIQPIVSAARQPSTTIDSPIQKAGKSSYRELEERKERASKLRGMLHTMAVQKELMGKGRKRKLRDDEVTVPTELPVYKWRVVRKK